MHFYHLRFFALADDAIQQHGEGHFAQTLFRLVNGGQRRGEVAGEMAFTMLLDRIISKREESQVIEVHPKLIERRSVADGPFIDYRR